MRLTCGWLNPQIMSKRIYRRRMFAVAADNAERSVACKPRGYANPDACPFCQRANHAQLIRSAGSRGAAKPARRELRICIADRQKYAAVVLAAPASPKGHTNF